MVNKNRKLKLKGQNEKGTFEVSLPFHSFTEFFSCEKQSMWLFIYKGHAQ